MKFSKLTEEIKRNLALVAKIAAIVFVTLGIGTGINYLLAQQQGGLEEGWVPPTGPPPTEQIAPSLNTSGIAQVKEGGLIVNSGEAAISLVSNFGTAIFGLSPDEIPDKNDDPFYDNSLVVKKIRITDDAQDSWVLTSDAFGNAAWAAPQGGGGGGTSCPSSIDEEAGPVLFSNAVLACRGAGQRLPTAEELACFVGSSPIDNFLWTRTPIYDPSSNNRYVIMKLSDGGWNGATPAGSQVYRCVN